MTFDSRRVIALAPAKINLALHVTGRRADGYHLLDTLAVFTQAGDRLILEPAEADRFTLSGPMAGKLDPDGPNLVTAARDLLRTAHPFPPVAIHLEKNLPVASGIGGGSSDAAAALRGLNTLFSLGLATRLLAELSLPLGADLPMCVHARPLRAEGIGEAITPLAAHPVLHMVLANPGVAMSTPSVFKALASPDNPPLPDPAMVHPADLPGWLAAHSRSDLQAPACTLAPGISACLAALQATSPLLARMSGSGATCFALYDDAKTARAAANRVAKAHPQWFVEATTTLEETDA